MLDPIVREIRRVAARLEPAQAVRSDQIPETKTTTWVEPVHVCEVRFREWTPDGVLRHAGVPPHARRQASARMRATGVGRRAEAREPEPNAGDVRRRTEQRRRAHRAAPTRQAPTRRPSTSRT